MTSNSSGRSRHETTLWSREIAARMADACLELLDSLGSPKRALASFPFDDPERTTWHYVPKARDGLPLKQMDEAARALTRTLLATVLSSGGNDTVEAIIDHEVMLGAAERAEGKSGHARDPGLYYISVFGAVGGSAWGWRFEGHHLSLHFTIVDGKFIAMLPSFLGANPAEVRSGPDKGLRILAPLEDRARVLLEGLEGGQRDRALLSDRAPADIITSNDRSLSLRRAEGLPGAALAGHQREHLMALLEAYTGRLEAHLAEEALAAVRHQGLDSVHFGWAGGLATGEPHYYRVQGPRFFAEYDNVQNGANHIHTVWRDSAGDFGEDILKAHYAREHGLPKGAGRRLS